MPKIFKNIRFVIICQVPRWLPRRADRPRFVCATPLPLARRSAQDTCHALPSRRMAARMAATANCCGKQRPRCSLGLACCRARCVMGWYGPRCKPAAMPLGAAGVYRLYACRAGRSLAQRPFEPGAANQLELPQRGLVRGRRRHGAAFWPAAGPASAAPPAVHGHAGAEFS